MVRVVALPESVALVTSVRPHLNTNTLMFVVLGSQTTVEEKTVYAGSTALTAALNHQ